jgi:putative holliday junction resolvase
MRTPLHASRRAVSNSTPGVILAIDYGQKRLGLALSDENQLLSRPYATWLRTNRRRDLGRLRELIREEGVCRIVVGLPLHLDGTPSEMSEEARRFAVRLEKALCLPVAMVDERLTSWEAHEMLAASRPGKRSSRHHSAGTEAKPARAVDNVAAAIILRNYLAQTQTHSGSRA